VPTTSSFRSGERLSHQVGGAGSGGREARPLPEEGVFPLSLPGGCFEDIPFGFDPALGLLEGKENGVFNGIMFF
jgi:hypothetical protein